MHPIYLGPVSSLKLDHVSSCAAVAARRAIEAIWILSGAGWACQSVQGVSAWPAGFTSPRPGERIADVSGVEREDRAGRTDGLVLDCQLHLLRVRLHYHACRDVCTLEVEIRRALQLSAPIGGGDAGKRGLDANGKRSASHLKDAEDATNECHCDVINLGLRHSRVDLHGRRGVCRYYLAVVV